MAVEIRAGKWDSYGPSYDMYRDTARALINPLLTAYNREEQTRYHMTIQSRKNLEPRLPPVSALFFRHFSVAANKSMLSLTDWRRFYEFVRVSRRKLPHNDLLFLLIKEGFSKAYAEDIVTTYEHLSDFKQPATAAEILEFHHVRKRAKVEVA